MDMPEKLQQLRHLYGKIYDWHREIGVTRYRKKFADSANQDNQWFMRYLAFLENLPAPDLADVEVIHKTAHEVLCGCMEWSYGESIAPDATMASVARKIVDTIERDQFDRQNHRTEEGLRSLRNIGTESFAPHTVEIEIPVDFNLKNMGDYERLATLAYSDLPQETGDSGLGGYVTLADSNLERELKRDNHQGTLKFRNAAALGFEPATGKELIANLIKDGTLTVETVTIGKE